MFGISSCDFIILVACSIMSILQCVLSHCSEAHRQTCSLPYLQLQQVSAQLSPTTQLLPDYNETTLQTICNVYTDYSDCSKPFLSSCNQNTLVELQTYDVTLGLICGNLSKEYLKHRSCFQRLQKAHSTCKDKEISSIQNVDTTRNAYSYILCSSTKEYILCIYSSTALGCSIQAADLLFQVLNQSVRSVFQSNLKTCDIRHPMDVITIYTTTSSSTTYSTQPDMTTLSNQDTPGHFVRTSGTSTFHRMSIYLVIFSCISFTTSVYIYPKPLGLC